MREIIEYEHLKFTDQKKKVFGLRVLCPNLKRKKFICIWMFDFSVMSKMHSFNVSK